jgi:predicted ABC-type ATPase
MSKELDGLKKDYAATSSDVNKIADRIIKNLTAGITSHKQPKVVILGGQPGSGKGELTTQAQTVVSVNAVICNADDFRDLHPFASQIKKQHESLFPDLTAEFAQECNNRLRQYCEDHKFNYILETTFSSGDRMNETIANMRSKGYNVSIMLLSVHHNLSFLGTRLRYEAMRAQSGYGRTVSKEQHDSRYNLINTTLKSVLKARRYNNLYIFARASRQRLLGTKIGLRQLSLNGDNPLKDYMDERSKHWSENDLRYFTTDILQLIRTMVSRKASNEELQEIFDVFDLENIENLLAPDGNSAL